MVEHKKNPIIYIGITIIALLIIILIVVLKGKSGTVNNSNEPIIDKQGNLVLPENNDPYVYGVTRDAEHIFEETGRFGYNVRLNKMPNTAWEPYYYLDGKEISLDSLDLVVKKGEYWFRFEENNGYYLFTLFAFDGTFGLGKHNVKFGFRDKENKKSFWEVKKDFEVEHLDVKVDITMTKKKGTYLKFTNPEDVKTKSFEMEYDLDYIEWDYTITNNMPYDLNGVEIILDISRDKFVNGKYVSSEKIPVYNSKISVLTKGVNKPEEKYIILPKIDMNDYEYMIQPHDLLDWSYFKDSYPLSTIKRNIMPKYYLAGNLEWIVNSNDEVIKGVFIKPGDASDNPYIYYLTVNTPQTQIYSDGDKLDLEALS